LSEATDELEVCPRLGTCSHADYEHKLVFCYGDHRRCPFFRDKNRGVGGVVDGDAG
jgi:hypothetical protein